jgi:serine protease Do
MVEHNDDYEKNKSRGGIWSFIGYLSFGVLGVFLGAVLIYCLFSFFLVTETEEIQPEVLPEVAEVLPEVEAIPEPREDLVDVVEKTMPAVVGVARQTYITRFGEQHFEQIESGSGVVISSDGYIATNYHVVENADKISVLIPGKGRYDAELIGIDTLTDLALLKIDENGLVSISLGDSEEINIGETVVAIGNPLGLQQTVTAGIISAVGRQVRFAGSEFTHTFLQTDALINPGNSGGPLVNTSGEMIGINTAKVAILGVEGIGLAVPSRTVIRVMDDIKEFGRVIRPHFGLLLEDWLNYEDDREPIMGVRIVEVLPDSAADQAGLLPGDIIVSIGDHDVHYMAQLFDSLLSFYPDDTVSVIFYREGEEQEVEVTLGERPEVITFPDDIFEPDDQDEGLEEEEEEEMEDDVEEVPENDHTSGEDLE